MLVDGTILNTVTTYVEAVGRKRSIRHWNTLDSLEVIYTGPTAMVEEWIPKIGQHHPDYPTMYFDSAEVTNEAATITELRCTYVGKYYGIGPVAKGQTIQWGESSWTDFANYNATLTPSDDPTQPPTTTFEFISYSWACRYQLECFTYKSLARQVTLMGGPGGGVMSQYSYRTGKSSTNSGIGLISSQLTFPILLLDQSANSLNNGWYELSETWGPRATINTNVFDIQTGTSTTTLGGGISGGGGGGP